MPSEKRQRQKEARAARREEQRKAAARRELIRRITIALGLGATVAALLLVVAWLGGRSGSQLPPAYAAYREQPTACDAAPPPPAAQLTFEAPAGEVEGKDITVVLDTSCGEITIELFTDQFPETTRSFVFLANEGFYDGTVFHRIVTDLVIQGGDPTASGNGGPGYTIADELPPDDFTYSEHVVAMANAGRGTTGSQFFIVVGEEAEALPATFNVLGRVIDGFEVLERIEEVPTARQATTVEQSKPLETVYVESVEVLEG